VERTVIESRPVPVSRRTCAVAGPKGGVGRTTVAVNLAVAAASLGRSVLLVDLHSGVWSAARHLGCAGNRGGLLAALAAPSAEGIRAAAELRHGVLVLSRGRDDGLFPALDQEAVTALCRVAAQAYELVVLDTAPAPAPDDPGTYSALAAADQVLLTCDPGDPVSAESAAALTLLVRDLGRDLGTWHLVCNRQRPGAEQPRTVTGYFRDLRLPIALAATVSDESERHLRALRSGRPVALDDPGPASPRRALALAALGANPDLWAPRRRGLLSRLANLRGDRLGARQPAR
jgi:MinD-like ATPase involved in chromosome partitioning or flagellar assembly